MTIQKIARALLNGSNNIVFSGAGISTESNIPDYRSKGGLWERFRPVYFDEFMQSREARIQYWQRKSELYYQVANAKPNPAHTAVAELYRLGLIAAVITQNIDGLHQKAGLPDKAVVELHGNGLRIRCMSCKEASSIHEAQKRIEAGDPAPECRCGGYLKPDTISFGQNLDPETITRAQKLAERCGAMLVVGSTLQVHPAASLPVAASQAGAFLGIINLSETPCDNIADVLIRQKAGKALPAILEEIRNA